MDDRRPLLFIGNKNYSSWSMRPWLALRWAGVPFDERVVPLGGEGYGRSRIPAVRAVSPTGRVPALRVDGETIWDSLAICAWAVERAPAGALLPLDPVARAACWSATCEMHAGFAALRRDLGMNIRRRTTPREWPDDTREDLARVAALWGDLRGRFGSAGPFLFGARGLADAFFAPVATRLRTYGVALDATSAAWCEEVFADPEFRAWEAAAVAEPWSIAETDAL